MLAVWRKSSVWIQDLVNWQFDELNAASTYNTNHLRRKTNLKWEWEGLSFKNMHRTGTAWFVKVQQTHDQWCNQYTTINWHFLQYNAIWQYPLCYISLSVIGLNLIFMPVLSVRFRDYTWKKLSNSLKQDICINLYKKSVTEKISEHINSMPVFKIYCCFLLNICYLYEILPWKQNRV